jgi:hypothetical protein
LLVVWLVVSLILVEITFLKLLYSLPHFPSFTTTAEAKSISTTKAASYAALCQLTHRVVGVVSE